MSETKKRVQITFGKDLLKRMDAFCARTGMTRSAYVAYVVGTNLDQYEALTDAAASGVKELAMKSLVE